MVKRVLEHTAKLQLAFKIEEKRLVVLRPVNGFRQYLLGRDIELVGSAW
jgi:hypothetical protein